MIPQSVSSPFPSASKADLSQPSSCEKLSNWSHQKRERLLSLVLEQRAEPELISPKKGLWEESWSGQKETLIVGGFLFCFRKEYKLKYKLPIFKMHSLTKVLIYGPVRWKRTLHAEGVWCPLASPPSCPTHPQTTTDLLSLTANDFALPSFG